MRRSSDDFVIVNRRYGRAPKPFAIRSALDWLHRGFHSNLSAAEARGRAIARNSKTALWFQPAEAQREVLVVTFRPQSTE